jgi:hypothetical protein
MNAKMLLILAAIIGGTGAVFLLQASGEKAVSDGNSSGLIIQGNAIYVGEQQPGQKISVSMARLEKPAFVVIHEDRAGAPGRILGVSVLLHAGHIENPAPIALSRLTKDGETVYAMLYFDDGDRVFDANDDKAVLGPVIGTPMFMIVDISSEAAEPGKINP